MRLRDVMLCGACLLLVGVFGMAGQGGPTDQATEDVFGGTYNCKKFKEVSTSCDGKNKNDESCTPYKYHNDDPNGPLDGQYQWKLCVVGGMTCGGFDCAGCEIVLPCDHPDIADSCP